MRERERGREGGREREGERGRERESMCEPSFSLSQFVSLFLILLSLSTTCLSVLVFVAALGSIVIRINKAKGKNSKRCTPSGMWSTVLKAVGSETDTAG